MANAQLFFFFFFNFSFLFFIFYFLFLFFFYFYSFPFSIFTFPLDSVAKETQNDKILTMTDIFDWDFTTSDACQHNKHSCTADEMRSKRSSLEILQKLEGRVWWTSTGQHCRLGGDVPKAWRRRMISQN